MPLMNEWIEEKKRKCPYNVDVYCELFDRVIECHMDKFANCTNCITFKLKE
ncbi:MAG: hypothetical protein KKF44_04075 [Nanoarchaeota archaeon]|nr:hypothetical protein [Nanoarchaeota archaeon]